jgi:hypothetical protein
MNHDHQSDKGMCAFGQMLGGVLCFAALLIAIFLSINQCLELKCGLSYSSTVGE